MGRHASRVGVAGARCWRESDAALRAAPVPRARSRAAPDPRLATIKGPVPWKDDANAAYEDAYEEMTWCLARI
ncbi:hypothetical protein San01_20340 [Streptomyces angustmyceticus]|uniref:Uncharacterized protein n=1 Tax=Streptomyces angustmyceticus TaxID=285578 RepID=A0A5J4L566_9ACTN|nr:hypothetical protein San01_20340 [Streptomyces angustmyceticus]